MQDDFVHGNESPDMKDNFNHDDIDKTAFTMEDTVINIMESACNVFDNIYFAKSLGIISDKNYFYRHLNKGNWGSKLWFVTLILSARKSIRQLWASINTRIALQREIDNTQSNSKNMVNNILREKLTKSIVKCTHLIKDRILELIQTFIYLLIVTIDVFKVQVSKKWKRILEPASYIVCLFRFFTIGKGSF